MLIMTAMKEMWREEAQEAREREREARELRAKLLARMERVR